MNEQLLRALVAAGAIQRITIVAHGSRFHVRVRTPNGSVTAETRQGKVKSWVTLDAAARWVRKLGIGKAEVRLSDWQPRQRELPV